MFENLPFKKSSVGTGIGLVLGGGIVIVLFAAWLQNYKHGFSGKK